MRARTEYAFTVGKELEFLMDDAVGGLAGGDDLTGHAAERHSRGHKDEDESSGGPVHVCCFAAHGLMPAKIPLQT